ncbi:transposase, partial [Persicitalea sp.]|uniref:transposase n=1 Tax=Persicitalea sp. TaxID=3100273 RepID=UPI00359344F1
KWLKYLIDNEIDFIVRLKSGTYKEAIDQSAGRSYMQLCSKVKRSKVAGKVLGKPFVLEEIPLNFVVLKNCRQDADDPLVLLVTSLREPARSIADKYRMRWKIEAFFKHMKTNGFSLEAMNLGTESRCQLLMAIVVFAYVLSIKEGLKTYSKVRIKLYPDGAQEREESVFRHGLNSLMRFCANMLTFCRHLFSELGTNKIPTPIMILENVQ